MKEALGRYGARLTARLQAEKDAPWGSSPAFVHISLVVNPPGRSIQASLDPEAPGLSIHPSWKLPPAMVMRVRSPRSNLRERKRSYLLAMNACLVVASNREIT